MKTTLSIDASKARELYNAGCGAVKTILEESFGKDFFKRDIADRVKTYEDALNVLGVEDFLTVRNGSTCTFGKLLSSHMVAYIKLRTIIKALNEGWKPNWNDGYECKYYPYFVMSPSSFAFSGSAYADSFAHAGSGSLLCLKSKELSDYCGKQFIDLWRDVQLGY